MSRKSSDLRFVSNRDHIGKCLWRVDWWCHRWHHVSGITLVTSQSSKSSHSETRTRIDYPCWPFKHTLKENIVTEDQFTTDEKNLSVYVSHWWLLVIDFVQSYNVFIELVVIVCLLLFWLSLSRSVILVVALQPTASTVSTSLIQSLVVCGVQWGILNALAPFTCSCPAFWLYLMKKYIMVIVWKKYSYYRLITYYKECCKVTKWRMWCDGHVVI